MINKNYQQILDTEPQKEVYPMLKINWTLGQNLPQGFQDSDGGFIGDKLITVCGFCSGGDNHKKPGRYPRGFLKKVWAWDITDSAKGWVSLPDFPGAERQGLSAVAIGNELYCWGGFSYSSPYTYQDGYRLSQRHDVWIWEPLPPLPYPLCASSVCTIGTKIYLFGGADYDYEKFSTDTDRAGENARLGSHLLVLDTKSLDAGWKMLSDCPGTPRAWHATAVVHGKLYVIGGATGDNPAAGKDCLYCTVVDNWAYDPVSDDWTRLRDLPISSGNFPKGNIVFKDRYLLLIGGFQYAKVANPDGTLREKYGKPSQFADQGEYFNDVFVYDVHTGLFGMADSLPINNNLPMATVRDDEIFLLGGECDARIIDGEYYGHHPDLVLQGKIEEIQ